MFIDIEQRKYVEVKTPLGNMHAFEWIASPVIHLTPVELNKNLRTLMNHRVYKESKEANNTAFVVIAGTMPA